MYRVEDLEACLEAYRRRAQRERAEEEHRALAEGANIQQQQELRRAHSSGGECVRAPEGLGPDDRDLALSLMAMEIEQEQMLRRQEKAAARFKAPSRPPPPPPPPPRSPPLATVEVLGDRVNDSDVALALVMSLESQGSPAPVDQDELIVRTELSDEENEEDNTHSLSAKPPPLHVTSPNPQHQQPDSPPAVRRTPAELARDAEMAWRLVNQEEEQQQRERRRQAARVEKEEQKLRIWLLKEEQRALKEATREVKEQRRRETEQKFRLKREPKEAPLVSLLSSPLLGASQSVPVAQQQRDCNRTKPKLSKSERALSCSRSAGRRAHDEPPKPRSAESDDDTALPSAKRDPTSAAAASVTPAGSAALKDASAAAKLRKAERRSSLRIIKPSANPPNLGGISSPSLMSYANNDSPLPSGREGPNPFATPSAAWHLSEQEQEDRGLALALELQTREALIAEAKMQVMREREAAQQRAHSKVQELEDWRLAHREQGREAFDHLRMPEVLRKVREEQEARSKLKPLSMRGSSKSTRDLQAGDIVSYNTAPLAPRLSGGGNKPLRFSESGRR